MRVNTPNRPATFPAGWGLLGAAVLSTGLAVTSCSRPAVNEAGPPTDGRLIVGTAVDMTGVNQLTGAHSRFSQDILDLLFLSLFTEQPDFADRPPTFAPGLAARHSWSDDDLALRIELRRDVLWSDGTPLTAEDVLWSFEAQTRPEIAWPYASSKRSIERVEVIDTHEIIFHFSEVYATRIADINEGVILPKHAWKRLDYSKWRDSGQWFVDNLVVSGPFDLAHWRPQEEIVLVRNPRYHRPLPGAIRQVTFRVIPDHANRLRQLIKGDLDFVEQLRVEDVPAVTASEKARPVAYWHRQYSYVVWNGCRALFNDPRVRRALTLAIDRNSIVEALFEDQARVGVTPIPRSVWASDKDLEPLPYDPASALSMLAEAGWGDSDGDGLLDKGGASFQFELSTNAENSLRLDAATMIQDHLARIGVDAQVRSFEFNTLIDRNMTHQFDATIGAWGIDTTLDMSYAFHSDSANGGYNYGCYSNPEVDELIETFADQSTLEAGLPLLREIQRLIHSDQPYTFLWEPKRIDGVGSRLHGVQPTALSAFSNLEEWALRARHP